MNLKDKNIMTNEQLEAKLNFLNTRATIMKWLAICSAVACLVIALITKNIGVFLALLATTVVLFVLTIKSKNS